MSQTDTVVPFVFRAHEIRVINRNDEPWFVAKDVCDALGYANSRGALADHLDADEKGVANADTLGGQQQMQVINESGLYALVLRSRKPEARPFAKWVTGEVLPSIRKTGGYGDPAKIAKYREVACAAGCAIEREIFKALLNNADVWPFVAASVHVDAIELAGRRSGENISVQILDRGAYCMTLPEIAENITMPDGRTVSDEHLAQLAEACIGRLKSRAINRAKDKARMLANAA